MPKIIDEARERIIASAKNRLFEQGYGALTLRSVAKDCSIAVGTIYNYFKSKDMLVASVMIGDWMSALEDMRCGIERAESIVQGMRAVYDAIVAFARRYSPVWSQFVRTPKEPGITEDRHALLRTQICERIDALLVKFERGGDRRMSPLIAETTLAAALASDIDYEVYEAMIKRLFSSDK